jgi:outer membrane protein assembly factor BamB
VSTRLRAASFIITLVSVAAVAACSSPPPASLSPAAETTACRHAAPGRLLTASTVRNAGDIQWSALLARCAAGSSQQWLGTAPYSDAQAALAPGGRLAIFVNGLVSVYDTGTGTRLWQRNVAPPAASGSLLLDLEVSGSLVMVQYTPPAPGQAENLTTFLTMSGGHVLGKVNATVPGDPFLAGWHVVLSDGKNTLEGYDPGTGRVLWRTRVPDAPAAQAAITDGTVVYLDSAARSGDYPPPMRRIDRLDPATGRMLAPIVLPRPFDFDLSVQGGNGFAQGLLILDITAPCASPGCPVTQTVAVDPADGKIRWIRSGEVIDYPAGLFSLFAQDTGVLTAVSPATGQDAWTLHEQGLGTQGGPDPVLIEPGYVVASSQDGNGNWAVTGISPGNGRQLWASPRFPSPMYMASGPSAVYILSCTPWGTYQDNLCSDITLLAVTAGRVLPAV